MFNACDYEVGAPIFTILRGKKFQTVSVHFPAISPTHTIFLKYIRVHIYESTCCLPIRITRSAITHTISHTIAAMPRLQIRLNHSNSKSSAARGQKVRFSKSLLTV